jgi:mannose-6-phosphate isomerase-like protein (cupin superfamily)
LKYFLKYRAFDLYIYRLEIRESLSNSSNEIAHNADQNRQKLRATIRCPLGFYPSETAYSGHSTKRKELIMIPWRINLTDVPEARQQWKWEHGNYDRFRRHISVALGNTREHPHPFDVELTRLPPGARSCPVHSHSHMWEFFIIVSGRAAVQRGGETAEAVAGDCFMQPAGTPHRIRNASETEDLVYYVIANEAGGKDVCQKVEI